MAPFMALKVALHQVQIYIYIYMYNILSSSVMEREKFFLLNFCSLLQFWATSN